MHVCSPAVGQTFVEKSGRRDDPLSDQWEAAALCVLGVDTDSGENDDQRHDAAGTTSCPGDDLLTFAPQFGRSWGDEFGAAIKNDISKMVRSTSYPAPYHPQRARYTHGGTCGLGSDGLLWVAHLRAWHTC